MATTTSSMSSGGLGERLRHSLALAQTRIQTVEEQAKARWIEIPASLKSVLARARERIRTTLDLPSRDDIAGLMARLDELDRKLEALESARSVPALEAGEPEAATAAPEPVTSEPEAAPEAAEPSATRTTKARRSSTASKTARKKTTRKKTSAKTSESADKAAKPKAKRKKRTSKAGA